MFFHNRTFRDLPQTLPQNIHVCTVYTNLGEEGILHAMSETGCSVVITSHNLLHLFERLLPKLPAVKHLIYFEDQGCDSMPIKNLKHSP